MKNELLQTVLEGLLKMINIQAYNNAMNVCQVAMQLVKDHNYTLPEMEQGLRELDSRVFMLGLPLHIFNGDKTHLNIVKGSEHLVTSDEHISILPNSDKRYEYALWVCMNGKDEIEKTLDQFHLTFSEVDISLERTGFAAIKD